MAIIKINMFIYYYNPTTQELITYDIEEKKLFIIQKIESIQISTGCEIKLGKFEGTEKKKKGSHAKISPEIIDQIQQLKKEGKTLKEIAKELGISEMSAWKYSKK